MAADLPVWKIKNNILHICMTLLDWQCKPGDSTTFMGGNGLSESKDNHDSDDH